MRPINLIPEEERRRGSGVVTRTGPVAYLLVGALAVLLIGVVMLVLFNNSIDDRKSEVARLEIEKTAATAQATKLSPYIHFKQVSEDRTRTVAELADSRFDWVRVIRQLSLVLPGSVYFESFGASGGGGEGGVAGPSLNIEGCAAGQPAVAGFVASLKEIDGVTRVKLDNSVVNHEVGDGGGAANSNGEPCSEPGMARFEVLVAFDAAPPVPDAAGSTVGEAAESEESESSEEEGSEEESSEGESSESDSTEGSEGSSGQSASAATGGATG